MQGHFPGYTLGRMPSIGTFKTSFKRDGSDPFSLFFSLHFTEEFSVHSLQRVSKRGRKNAQTDRQIARRAPLPQEVSQAIVYL